jgi:hypothetical protein
LRESGGHQPQGEEEQGQKPRSHDTNQAAGWLLEWKRIGGRAWMRPVQLTD